MSHGTPPAALLDLTLRVGVLLHASGAETWRTEDTMHRLLVAWGADGIEVVATATAIFGSLLGREGVQTRVRRVRGGALDLARIDAVNRLSRRTVEEGLAPELFRAQLEQIERQPHLYPFWPTLTGALLAASGFALLFGAGTREMLPTLSGALALSALLWPLERAGLPALATTALVALVGTVVAALAARALPGTATDIVVLSTVVLLVPGAAIVNAIGDLLGGHLLSGLARGAASGLVAAAIAAGVVAGLQVVEGLL